MIGNRKVYVIGKRKEYDKSIWQFWHYYKLIEEFNSDESKEECDIQMVGESGICSADEFKANHVESWTLEAALEIFLRLQCNDHQKEKDRFWNKSFQSRFWTNWQILILWKLKCFKIRNAIKSSLTLATKRKFKFQLFQ